MRPRGSDPQRQAGAGREDRDSLPRGRRATRAGPRRLPGHRAARSSFVVVQTGTRPSSGPVVLGPLVVSGVVLVTGVVLGLVQDVVGQLVEHALEGVVVLA